MEVQSKETTYPHLDIQLPALFRDGRLDCVDRRREVRNASVLMMYQDGQ